jgi:MYXO-CTERM domain-containing protein
MSKTLTSVLLALAVTAVALGSSPTVAAPVTLRFTNADANLGGSSFLPVTNEYEALWGIRASNAYRYYDGRDPFSDAPNELAACGVNPNAAGACNFGLGALTTPGYTGIGRIDFLNPTTFITFDWFGFFCCNTTSFRAIDAAGNVVDSFSVVYPSAQNLPIVSGTQTFTGPIAAFEWTSQFSGDPTARVANAYVANLSYDLGNSGQVAEPGSLALAALGLALSAALSRRRKSAP